MKHIILYISLLWCCGLLSAQQLESDSLYQLNEIAITANKLETIAVQKISNKSASNTSILLEQNSPIYLNRQSSNGLATISIRGSAATNVPILWENWTINSSMNSLFDINLINPYLFDEMQINYGSSKLNAGWGGAGGSLQFSNGAENYDKTKAHKTNFHFQLGSFGQKEVGLNYLISKANFQNNFKIVYNQSDNDFPILKENNPNSSRTNNVNAALKNRAFINKTSLKLNDENDLVFNAWWHFTEREIPPTLTVTNINALQTDSAGRFSLNWENINNWNIGFAFFDELNLYEAEAVNIYGRHKVKSWLSHFNHHFYVNSSTKLENEFKYESYLANSTNINEAGVRRNRLLLLPKLTHQFSKLPIEAILGISAEYTDRNWAPLLPSASITSQLDKYSEIKFLLARHYRLPSFNDLYWQPGGNVNLIAESGWNQELIFASTIKQFSLKLNLFNNNTINKIIWLPEQGIWRPNNIAKVQSNGIEAFLGANVKLNKQVFKIDGFYTLTNAVNKENSNNNNSIIGKQLLYTPKHKTGVSINYQLKNFTMNWSQSLTGKRFTNSDNSNAIEAYHLANFNVGYQFKIKTITIETGFNCENIFNKYYEVVLNRPMPGRSYLINLNIK